jgi:hypothetical protein
LLASNRQRRGEVRQDFPFFIFRYRSPREDGLWGFAPGLIILAFGAFRLIKWTVRAGMSVYLLRPRVADLVFQLHGRPIHPEFFDILASRKIQREDFELTVRITRTGHVVSWERQGLILTEVATSADLAVPSTKRLLNYRVRGEHTDSVTCAAGVRYQMSFQVEALPEEIFMHVHDEILADGAKRGLLFNFQPNHRLSLSPLGLVTAESGPNCLILSSFHTFPDENTVVKTQSLIEIGK